MGTMTSEGTASKVPMRERIVEAATELFYAQGLRAVSAEKIIARVGITKVTFYRHFPAKDDLIVAYLERRATWERDAIAQARQSADDTPHVFRIIAEAIGAESCTPGFRGCPFINAAAEYADPEHPVRRAVDTHRRWFRQTIQELLEEINVQNPARVADQLVMLRDGAMVSGYLSDPATVADALYNAGRAIIATSSALRASGYPQSPPATLIPRCCRAAGGCTPGIAGAGELVQAVEPGSWLPCRQPGAGVLEVHHLRRRAPSGRRAQRHWPSAALPSRNVPASVPWSAGWRSPPPPRAAGPARGPGWRGPDAGGRRCSATAVPARWDRIPARRWQ